jgi:hypothetical protein
MSSVILQQLGTIRDQLDTVDEAICAAHIQLVIDKLETRETSGVDKCLSSN